ncbi:MAG: AMIN domain-containing protein [Sulfurovum sp.]|nr:AMIN domain-containing protein [Sulfurovum sp.]
MKRLLFFLFLGTVWAFASIAILEKAELKKRELQLHFNGSYDKGKIRHFTLKHPYREVFDIPNARLKHSHIGKNLISPHCYSIRISQYKKNTVRITLETGKKYNCKPYRSFFAYNVYHIPLSLNPLLFSFYFFIFLCPVSEDGYITVNDQEDSATWLIDVPVHQLPVHFDAFIPDNRKVLPIHSPNVLHIIYLSMPMLTLQLTT